MFNNFKLFFNNLKEKKKIPVKGLGKRVFIALKMQKYKKMGLIKL